MSEPYVQTTDEVRRFFVNGKSEEEYAASWIDRYASEFDRWLAAHDRKVKAEALRVARYSIRDRARNMQIYGASEDYAQALNDAWGLVSNQLRTIESEETP